jgi:hypothetical protein
VNARTAAAIEEVTRVAYKQITGEDPPEPLDITISRGPSWCGVEADYIELEAEKIIPKRIEFLH